MNVLVELAGLACLVVAAALVAPALGWLVAGGLLIVVAEGLDGTVSVRRARAGLARLRRPRRRSP